MSEKRRQDLVYPPGPETQREEGQKGHRLDAEVPTITGRLLARFSLIRHDAEAILQVLRQVPRIDRLHARIALFQALGGQYTHAGPRALALCERVFGAGTMYFPGERETVERQDQPSPETPASSHAAEAEPKREPVLEPEAAFDQGRIQTLCELLERLVSQPSFPPALEILALLDAAESHVAKAALSRLNYTPLPGEGRYGKTYYQALQQTAGESVSDHLTGRWEMIERMLPGRHRAGRPQNPPPLPLETRLLHHRGRLGGGQLLGSWDKSATQAANVQRHAEAEERLAEDHPALAVLGQGGGEPLPEAVLGRMNRLLGHDFSHVRIHTDTAATKVAQLLGARALAFGTHVYFGAGQFAPGTPAGDRLLLHELVHVVQFDEGRLPARRGAALEVSQPEEGAEQEAETRAQSLDVLDGASLRPPGQTDAHVRGGASGPDTATAALLPRAAGDSPVRVGPTAGLYLAREDSGAAPGGGLPPDGPPEPIPPAGPMPTSPAAPQPHPNGPHVQGEPQPQHVQAGAQPQGGSQPHPPRPQRRQPLNEPPPRHRPQPQRGGHPPQRGRGPQPSPPQFGADPRLAARPAEIEQAKAEITLAGEAAKTDVHTAATAEKDLARAAIAERVARVGTAFDDALRQIDGAHAREVARINTDRDTQVSTLTREAQRVLDALDRLIREKQADIRGRGDRKAQAAINLGNQQAQRVLDASAAKQREAWTIASRKAAQYRSQPRAPLIERRINEATRAVVDRMQQNASRLAAKLRHDGQDLAAKFRREAEHSAGEVRRLAGTARDGVTRERDDAIRNIRQIANDNISQLDRSHTELVGRLDEARRNAMAPLQTAPIDVEHSIDHGATLACEQIDQATDSARTRIDTGEAQAAPRLALLSGLALTQALAEADAAIAAAIQGHRTSLTGFVRDARTGMHTTADQAATSLGQAADRTIAPVAQMASDFDAQATALGTDALTRSARIAAQATGGWNTRIVDARTSIEGEIQTVDADWQCQLDEARAEMTRQADRVIAEFGRTVTSLPHDLDTIADRIINEGLLSRIWHGFVGFVLGILDRLGDLVMGLLVLLLLVLAIVVILIIIGVIVFFVGGPAALFAFILGVVAVVAAIGAFLVAYGTIILVVLAVITIGLSLWHNLPIILDPTRTDEERWRAIGHVFADVILSIFAEKIFGWLGKLGGRIARLLGIVGSDEARLARLLALVGGDEARLARLVRAFGGDAARLDAVLARIGNDAAELERLLTMVGNDGLRLERLLGIVDNDVVRLQALIRNFGNDAAQLERALGAFGGDIARAEAALGRCGNDAQLFDDLLAVLGENGGQLERMLGLIGEDAASGTRLKELLRLTNANAGGVERLLGLPQFANNAARLERALNACDDIAQLDGLIAAIGNDGQMLEDFLRLSGATRGSGVAGELEQLVNFAKGRGAAAGDLRDLLTIANGDAARFRQFADWARRFRSPRTGAPNTQPSNLAGTPTFSGTNTEHFMTRHTFEFFNVNEIKDANTFFDSSAEIMQNLESAINELRAAFAGQPFPAPNGRLGVQVNGRWFQIGWKNGPTGPNYIGQFFPSPNTPGLVNIPENIMQAIAKIIGP